RLNDLLARALARSHCTLWSARPRPPAWHAGSLCLLALALMACVEPARSADAPAPARAAAAVEHKTASVQATAVASDAHDGGREAAPAPSATAAPDKPTIDYEADSFLGLEADEPLRVALSREDIKSVERGRGGHSLDFKILLNDGHRAYFKAEQTFSAANWFGEVAAYHLDRMLGLGRVPCVVSREFEWSRL